MTDGILEQDLAEELQPAALPKRPLLVGRQSAVALRARAEGKFLFVGEQKLLVRGVTYGPFAPAGPQRCEYGTRSSVQSDFAQMRDCGLNAVRTYTVPPRWLLDEAQEMGLYVMVGLPWEQHLAFLDQRRQRRDIERRVRLGVESCAGHPSILCYAIGNEIPAQIVRWYGPRRIEKWLHRLYELAKGADPDALVTYVNYPSTEYLDLPLLDLVSFNVYLESEQSLRRYLARLQNISGDRPLLMAEVGLDAMRNGEQKQAQTLDWQVRTALSCGCAGSFIFSWTDQWYRGGHEITDWQFGLTDRARRPRPALAAVSRAFSQEQSPPAQAWPKVSVVVCTYNGATTLEQCLRGISRLDYPDYEVIVVDDGSTDQTSQIARQFEVHLIRTTNGGLSNARNIALHAATGQIIAYLDDDAYPDPDWLKHLSAAFSSSDHAGIGGPNIPPPGDPALADCVAHAPGGPTHVLLSDTEAEHIPGCNMAFRRERLLEIGGFDPQFHIAGDDVDICWRLHERGWTLGFSPAAVVWHHRRGSIRGYLKQQLNYGRAEAMLERKWPQKYNAAGHLVWAGRLYGKGYLGLLPWRRRRIYHGTWGTALFQSVYHASPSLIGSLPTMPEWYLLTVLLGLGGLFGLICKPLLWVLPVAAAMALATLLVSVDAGLHARIAQRSRTWMQRVKYRTIVILLHLIQPVARLIGRLHLGLTPWRLRGLRGFAFPRPRRHTDWSEQWRSPEQRLGKIESHLRSNGGVVVRGGSFDRWDLELRGGMFGAARLHMTIEEHGSGRQLTRFRTWPKWCGIGLLLGAGLGATAAAASLNGSVALCAISGTLAGLLLGAAARESSAALATMLRALRAEERDDS